MRLDSRRDIVGSDQLAFYVQPEDIFRLIDDDPIIAWRGRILFWGHWIVTILPGWIAPLTIAFSIRDPLKSSQRCDDEERNGERQQPTGSAQAVTSPKFQRRAPPCRPTSWGIIHRELA